MRGKASLGIATTFRAEVSPNLTPFTLGVSVPGAQCFKSLASTSFATRAAVGRQ